MSSKLRFLRDAAFSMRHAVFMVFALLWLGSGMAAFAEPRNATTAKSPGAETFLKRDEALALAFPKCKVERGTSYLSKEQIKRVAGLAKVEFKNAVVYPYRATKDGKWMGTAYFDTHRVRSLRETVMIVVLPDHTIGRVEVLSFAEPKDYLPRAKWYAQFPGRKLDNDLNLNRKIRGVTGATLTSNATTQCARRVLALDQVLREIEAKKREEAAKKKAQTPRLSGVAGAPVK